MADFGTSVLTHQPPLLLKVNLDGARKQKPWPEQGLQICHPTGILNQRTSADDRTRLSQAPAGPSANQC